MSESADIRNLWLVVAVYVVIFAAKIAAYFASGVMAVFAEALHTLSDIFISGFLLFAAIYSQPGEKRQFRDLPRWIHAQ